MWALARSAGSSTIFSALAHWSACFNFSIASARLWPRGMYAPAGMVAGSISSIFATGGSFRPIGGPGPPRGQLGPLCVIQIGELLIVAVLIGDDLLVFIDGLTKELGAASLLDHARGVELVPGGSGAGGER